MYDDLARTQIPTPLEWFVVHAVIPTVLVTAALHWSPAVPTSLDEPACLDCRAFDYVIEEPWAPPGPIADSFPTLVSMPEAVYPDAMRRAGIGGRVVLRALVNTHGRVVPSSILVLRTTDTEFLTPAIIALSAARFRPATLAGARIDAWITIAVDFKSP